MIFSKYAAPLLLTACIMIGCSSVPPPKTTFPSINETTGKFDYRQYAKFLEAHVDESGYVDYEAAVKNSKALADFYGQISTMSPGSHRLIFETRDDALAYWINAYNATVLWGVIQLYPINSVTDVKKPALLAFIPEKSGFFVTQKFVYGKVESSLYVLKNSLIRKRFPDPRIHFALTGASNSGPRLPKKPFLPESLDSQLEFETRKFINDRQNVSWDTATQTLFLSPVFDWYEEDFIQWLEKHHPEKEANLFTYIQLYLSHDKATEWELGNSTKIEFGEYDWSLNRQ